MFEIILRILLKLRLVNPIILQKHTKKRELLKTLKKSQQVIVSTELLGNAFFYEPMRTSKSEIFGNSGLTKMLDLDNYNLSLLSGISSPVVLDIGSHIGIWPRVIYSKYSDAKIYSLEPDIDNYRILCLNNTVIPNAETFQYGVYDKKSKIKLRLSEQNSWRSSLDVKSTFFRTELVGEDSFSYGSYEVECISVDELVLQHGINKIDMIGVTVPGEIALPILRGGVKALKKFRPILSISLYSSETKEAKNFLKSHGYVSFGLPKGNMHTFVYDRK